MRWRYIIISKQVTLLVIIRAVAKILGSFEEKVARRGTRPRVCVYKVCVVCLVGVEAENALASVERGQITRSV